MANGGPGRRPELTEDLILKVAEELPLCIYQETLLAYLGISRTSWWRWMKAGGKARKRHARTGEPYADHELLPVLLHETVETASAGRLKRTVAHITAAAGEQWQAAAWLLERTEPELYGVDRERLRKLEQRNKELEGRLVAAEARALPSSLAARLNGSNAHQPPPQN
jgi:hypothetical protein